MQCGHIQLIQLNSRSEFISNHPTVLYLEFLGAKIPTSMIILLLTPIQINSFLAPPIDNLVQAKDQFLSLTFAAVGNDGPYLIA
jgi:hypothetical protein